MNRRLGAQRTFVSLLRPAVTCPRQRLCRYVSSTVETSQPNPPLHLDPDLQVLLKDVDISLEQHWQKHGVEATRRELEVFSVEPTTDQSISVSEEEDLHEEYTLRKSPAANFGSQQLGLVVLPLELQSAINSIILGSDKHRLRQDAKRLFLDERNGDVEEDSWDSKYDVKYRSRRQAERHYERDGTAYAAVALPAHFSAVTSVLDHLKHRLESSWLIENVIEWGAGMGGGLWAASYAFQRSAATLDDDEAKLVNSKVKSYLGIEKRDGLVKMGKRLVQGVNLGSIRQQWQRSFTEDDKLEVSERGNTLALSAFTLSSLPSPVARKSVVKEMWESGADVIVLIDHSTKEGFESIAEAREYLLRVGRRELDEAETLDHNPRGRGCHVVAPCPHDGACPLHNPGSTRLICGFSQRLQRPSFIRRTKHSGIGHEDVEYSYVVIRRGPRPAATEMKVGRIGEVGRRDIVAKAASSRPVKELEVHDGHEEAVIQSFDEEANVEHQHDALVPSAPQSIAALTSALKLEAYHWPRLVFPPLKKSGHIILDSCTPQGKIMRLTIPRSQGKQEYYDARKSSWGDLFPHEPKNTPQDRYQPQRAKREGGTTATRGADIGKRSKTGLRPDTTDHTFSEFLKEKKMKSRRDRTTRKEARRVKD